jgi:[acyl-carrier-protein] S-malonyltransferase
VLRPVDLDDDSLVVRLTVDWAACMEACRGAGPQRGLEPGPGDALARMSGDAMPEIAIRSATAFRSLDGIRRRLGS